MYRSYGLYFLQLFVVTLANVCTMMNEAGAAALTDTFQLGTGDSITCRGKIAPYLEEIFFILFDNSFIELPESNCDCELKCCALYACVRQRARRCDATLIVKK